MGKGNFFAVDRRVWSQICDLGKMNPAIAYLVLARGTLADLRTTSWSAKAIADRTALSWPSAKAAVQTLIDAGYIDQRRGGRKPRYYIRSVQEVSDIRIPMPTPESAAAKLLAALIQAGSKGIVPPGKGKCDLSWPADVPANAARELCRLGLAITQHRGPVVAVDQPISDAGDDWIWLPNSIVDGASGETPPIDRLRATQRPAVLRLFVDLYYAQSLASDGGISQHHIRKKYHRKKVGEYGQYDIYAFWPEIETASLDSKLLRPYMPVLTQYEYENQLFEREEEYIKRFWIAHNHIIDCGLADYVPHLLEGDTDEAALIHPLAHAGEGEHAEQAVGLAAHQTALAMLPVGTSYSPDVRLAPVERHIEQACVVGLLRLRHHAQTSGTAVWFARMDEWSAKARAYQEREVNVIEARRRVRYQRYINGEINA